MSTFFHLKTDQKRKGGEESQGTKSTCPFYRGVRLIDMSVKRLDYMGHVVGINMRD